MDDSWVRYAEEFTSSDDETLRALARECYANYSDHVLLPIRDGRMMVRKERC